MNTLERLPQWKGKAYRTYSGYKPSKTDTAADVVRYEQEELGNELGISDDIIKELESYPAGRVVWITRTKTAAKRYGEPVTINIPPGSRILCPDDGDGGSLIFLAQNIWWW